MINNLTILILTHNRPNLFYRLFEHLNKILKNECQIVVNNDSNDVCIPRYGNYKNVRLFYNKFDNLTNIYEFLIKCVDTEWFYILEDDDIPLNFLKAFEYFNNLNHSNHFDAIVGSYYTFDKKFIKYDLESPDFQLSQVIFKNKEYNFEPLYSKCKGNCIYNDYYLVKENIKNPFVTNYCFYKQTIDAQDNISFPEYSNDKRLNLNACKMCTNEP